jgi:RecA-family ATPase
LTKDGKLKGYDKDSQIFKQNYSLKEILEMDIPLVEYLIPNMLIKKGVTIVGGDSGSFKTFIALQMGLCLTSSISFMGNEIAKKYRVLYIDEENRLSTLKERLVNMIESFNISNANEFDFRFIVSNNIKLDGQYVSVTDIEILRKVCEDFKPDLIILDSLVRFISGDENSVKDVRKFFETLKNFIEEYNTSFLVIHHTIKNPTGIKHDLRGSGDFSAMADIIFISTKLRDNNILSQVKNRHAEEISDIVFSFKDGKLLWIGNKNKAIDNNTKVEREIIRFFKEEQTNQRIIKSGIMKHLVSKGLCSRPTAYRIINKLIDSGIITAAYNCIRRYIE